MLAGAVFSSMVKDTLRDDKALEAQSDGWTAFSVM